MDKALKEKMQESIDMAEKYISGMRAERDRMAGVWNHSAAAELQQKIDGAEVILHMFTDWNDF